MRALLQHLGILNIQVQNFGGVNELRPFLKALVAAPDFSTVTSLAIIRDAEGNAGAAEVSIRGALAAAGLAVPAGPLALAGAAPNVRVAYLVIPPGAPDGMLETMCLASVATDGAMPCVDAYFACLAAAGIVPTNLSKARVQAFLASRADPGLLVGQAAYAGHWPLGYAGFDPLKQLVALL